MKRSVSAIVMASVIVSILAGCGYTRGQQGNGVSEVSEAVSTWVCGECGATGNTGKFCADCGAERKTSSDTWVCSQCGAKSTGKFCTECGASGDSGGTANASSSKTESIASTTQSERKDEATTSTTSYTETSSIQTSSSEVISASKGTKEDPFKVGEWFYCKRYNATAGDYQDIEVKVTDIVRGSEATKCVDEYNNLSSARVSVSLVEGAELCIMKYEVRYPATWEMPEYGEYGKPRIHFSICGKDGGSVNHDNKRLVQINRDVSIDNDQHYYSGDTFTDGRLAFQMFEGFSDYLIEVGDKEKVYITAYILQ